MYLKKVKTPKNTSEKKTLKLKKNTSKKTS